MISSLHRKHAAARLIAGLALAGTAVLLATGPASARPLTAGTSTVHIAPKATSVTPAHDPALVTRIGTAVTYVRGANGQPVLVK